MNDIKTGLPPVAAPDARLLILGSLPGDASLAARNYYAHPTNQFWRLLGQAIGAELQSLSYADRIAALQQRRIALWDVIASADRRGSLDQSIRAAEHNPLGELVSQLPELQAIAFNGSTAASAGRKLIGAHAARLKLIDLPSSSAANTRRFDEKASAWDALGAFAGPQALPRAQRASS